MAAACGGYCTAVVVEDGCVCAFGRGDYGQLGLSSQEHQRQPARRPVGDAPVCMVAAGTCHQAAVAQDGAILTCGAGIDGQLGHGDGLARLRPTRLGPELFGGSRVVLVACGGYHTMAVTGAGRVWTCGRNANGQLGHGDKTSRQAFTLVDPGQFVWGGCSIVVGACGDAHSVVASADGDVFTWGLGACGRLGHSDEQDRLTPARLGRQQFGGGKIVLVAAGFKHTVAVAEGGVLWVWGAGGRGQLGLGDTDGRLVPTRLGADEVFGGSRVCTPACGALHTLVVTEDGVVWAFGKGENGRLGLNDEVDRLVPARVDPQRFAGAQIATVAAGWEHSAALTEGGALFTWGRGEVASYARSQVPAGLGHADLCDRLVPTLVSPRLLGGVRVGRCHGLADELALAFAMGTHARLGAGAAAEEGEDKECPYLMMPGELVKRVVDACRWDAGKVATAVVRLMGGKRS